MKIGIIGAGRVGCACALAAVTRGSARNIVILDRTRKRAKAVATDLSGKTVTWEPFKRVTSQLQVVAGEIEIKKP